MAIMRHLGPATHKETCDDEDKETMMTSAKKEALQREKCTNGLHYSAVVMANDDVQFEARAAAWTAGPSLDCHKHWAHFLRGAESGCALAQACATGALSMNIVGKMHGLLCDEDGLKKVGVNTHFTAVRFKTLQVDSPEVHQEDRLMCILTRLTTCFLEQEIHFLAHWRSTYPYRFAALLDPSSRDAAFTEIRVLVKALEEGKWKVLSGQT